MHQATKVARKRRKCCEKSDTCACGAEVIASAWVRYSHVSALHLLRYWAHSGGSDGLDHASLRLCYGHGCVEVLRGREGGYPT